MVTLKRKWGENMMVLLMFIVGFLASTALSSGGICCNEWEYWVVLGCLVGSAVIGKFC